MTAPDWGMLIPLFVVLALLLMASGWISASEVAFFSISTSDLEKSKGQAQRKAELEEILEQPRPLLATILVVNNFVNVGIVILSAFVSDQLFDFSGNELAGFIIEVVAITALILFFGEVMPKTLATRSSVPLALKMTPAMRTLIKVFSPITRVLARTSAFVEELVARGVTPLSVSDLSKALGIGMDPVAS